jgi:GNAT superfamily N-acetyltransferase
MTVLITGGSRDSAGWSASVWTDSGQVFTHEDGMPLRPTSDPHVRHRGSHNRNMAMPTADVRLTEVLPGSPEGRAVLWDYFRDIVSRTHGREATGGEVDAEMGADPSDDLCPPGGLFLVARRGTAVVGCVGLRLLPAGLGEVTRVFVEPAARGGGVGGLLMRAVEDAARDRGLTRVRLDTRSDLTEARRLYARNGYHPAAPFNEGWADLWFEKSLAG